MKNVWKKGLPVLLTAALFGLTACSGQAAANVSSTSAQTSSGAFQGTANSGTAGNTITVNSSETVTVVPDIAEVVYSVRTQAKDAAGCQQKNGEAVNSVIESLKGQSIAETSIQTSGFYMNPVYDYSSNTAKVAGYEAVTTLTVSDLPLDNLSDILSKSVESGINTVQSITYKASGYDQSYQEALSKAVASAHEKASVLAKAAGASVGRVVSIRETTGYTEARYSSQAAGGMAGYSMKEEMLADSAPIMPGEIQVEAGIVVEYELI